MNEKGTVLCKLCDKTYIPRDLKAISLGHGKTPFEINIPHEKKEALEIFHKNQKLSGLFGGNGYTCPGNHELITLIKWRA